MVVGIEGHKLSVDLVLCSPRELGFVIRFKWNYIQAVATDHNCPWILSGDLKPFFNLTFSNINNGNFILRRKRNVRLFIAGKGNADRFVKASRPCPLVKLLNGGNDLKIGRAGCNGIDDTDGIRNMIRDPNLFSVRSNRHTDRIHPDIDAHHDLLVFFIDDINGV